MLSVFKPAIDESMQRLVTPLQKVNPNIITLLGIVPSIFFLIAILNHNYVWACVFYLGNALDFVDGAVARRFHKVSRFGGFLDSTLDRVADFFLIASFGFAHIVKWELVVSLLFISYLVSYVRTRAEQATENKQKFAVGLIERPERLVILFVGFVLSLFYPTFTLLKSTLLDQTFILLILLSFVTFLQRVWIVYKRL